MQSEEEEPITTTSNQDNASPTSFHSSSIIDRKSKFVAHAKKATTKEEAEAFWRKVQATEKGATHNVLAYRIQSSDGNIIEEYHDDGETYAGNRVLTLLKTLDAKNVVVVVTRWFGGQLLGPIRFEHILKCSREVLDKGLLIRNKSSANINQRAGYSTNSIIVNGCQVLYPRKETVFLEYLRMVMIFTRAFFLSFCRKETPYYNLYVMYLGNLVILFLTM